MELLAPAEVTPPPFALCPRFHLLAVGVASSPAPRGDAVVTEASHVEVRRLLRPSGDLELEGTLQVDCVQQAPGLRRVAWASTPTKGADDALTPVEQELFPAGLLAGGFSDGAVRLWNPAPAILCDMKKASVSRKSPPLLMLNEDSEQAKEEEARISGAVSSMYSEIDNISWEYPGGKEYFQIEQVDDPECDVLSKEGNVATTEMKLLIETYSLRGPVLGLSFSEVYTYWMASAALGERIYINDLHHPFQISKKKRELPEIASETKTQTTCLKWSNTFPCILASTSDIGVTKIWDVRASKASLTFTSKDDKTCSSDLEFSLNNPWYLAVSSANSGPSAAVKIWDLRYSLRPCHEYGCGASGVLSLSWNRSGQLLGSHKDGRFSCYDIYKNKILEEMNLKSLHCDLGMTWIHADDTVATFSSKYGVKLSDVGWLLKDGF